MGSKASYPNPTAQERNLQQSQADMLNQQRDILQKQYQQQQLLAPILYKQNNIAPDYDSAGNITGFHDLGPTPEQQAYRKLMDYQLKGAESAQEAADYERALRPLQLQQAGYTLNTDANGHPTGLSVIQGGAADLQNQYLQSQLRTAQQQEGLNQQFIDRSQKAMRGELPVDPGMEHQFARSEDALRSQLSKNLGAGYETSTPGIQALAEFNQRKNDTISAAQHGEISTAAQLAMAGQDAKINPVTQNPNAILQSPSAGSYLTPFAAAGSPSGRSAQLLSAVDSPYMGTSGFGTLSQLYGDALGPYAAQRRNQYNTAIYNKQNSIWPTIGGIIGGAAGAYFGGPMGASAGSSIGSAAGRAFS